MSEEVEELHSNQEEADTKIVLHTLHASKHSTHDATDTVQSPDTKVFVLLLHVRQKIHQKLCFDTGSADKRRLLDVKGIIIADTGEVICMALPTLHVLSECDSTSAFVRKRQVSTPEVVAQEPKVHRGIRGTTEETPDHILDELEQFTCHLYGSSKLTKINKLRQAKFQ
jgi:hypothetical protein